MMKTLSAGIALTTGLLILATALPVDAQEKARPRSRPQGGQTSAGQPRSRPPSEGGQPARATPPPDSGGRRQPTAVPRTHPPYRPGDRDDSPYRPGYRNDHWYGSRVRVYYSPYYYSPYYYPWSWGWGGGWGWGLGLGWDDGYGYGYGYGQRWPFYPPYPYYSYRGLAGSLRVQFQPNTAEVYVDGSFAGTVDDFDGFFQNLPVEPGGRDITIYHEGFRSFTERIYVQPYRTFKLKGALVPLAAGEPAEPRPLPNDARTPVEPPDPAMAPQPGRPGYDPPPPPSAQEPPIGSPSNFGQVAIRVQPADAEVRIDDEPWKGPQGAERLVVHLNPGLHRIEIRKDGFDPFVTTVDVKRGETTVLNVSLGRVSGV